MKHPRALFFALLAVLAAMASPAARAAEFSLALEHQLAQASGADFVSAIVILESPIDIRALDERLHIERASRARRYREVIEALHYNAAMTQPAFRAELDEAQRRGEVRGYTPYWIENLFVVQATRNFIESLRPRGDVRYVTENFRAQLIEPVSVGEVDDGTRGRNPLDNLTLPPGIRAVGAYRVNMELGITGAGTIIGGLDTGVDGNHPALGPRWRGAGGAVPWQHCWRDALGGGTQFPSDGHGHGTHTMGTMCGRRISGNDTIWVGCAPGAQWIANNAINQGVSGEFDNDIIDAFQWFANPDGDINTLDDVPDVVQNSWGVYEGLGYPDCDSRWNTVILNCEAVGVVITWSAGNEGSSGLRDPAQWSINETQIFSVGAVDATNDPTPPYNIASFSSRGPSHCTPAIPNNIKPEISAPGVDVYSTYRGGGYTNMSGTSMAGPHVAGVVALMREACPDCDPTTIKMALIATAIRDGYVTPPATENNTFGNGFLDAYAAVMAVMGGMGRVMGTVRDAGTSIPLQAYVQVVGGPQSTTCAPNGSYSLMLRADSTYTLRFSLYGYYPQEHAVTVSAGDTTFLNVNLVARPVVTVFSEDFENGAPGWTHQSAGGQWVDNWHISTERSRSATHSYKCGDTGTGTYSNLCDARLISPVIQNLPPEARLTFYYQIEAELSARYPDSAYDGGILELSANGGPFNQVTPIGGYPKTFRRSRGGGNPATGPMLGLPCWSDSIVVWTLATVDLSAYEGQSVQLRFRFGSDAATTKEGWYVDDVAIRGFGPDTLPAPVEVTILVEPSTGDVILRWVGNDSPFYRIYTDIDPAGNFTTLVDSTPDTSYTIANGVGLDARRFYLVRSWNGQN